MWKDIIGWEKYYEINEHGDVRNKLTKHLVIGDKIVLGICVFVYTIKITIRRNNDFLGID